MNCVCARALLVYDDSVRMCDNWVLAYDNLVLEEESGGGGGII